MRREDGLVGEVAVGASAAGEEADLRVVPTGVPDQIPMTGERFERRVDGEGGEDPLPVGEFRFGDLEPLEPPP